MLFTILFLLIAISLIIIYFTKSSYSYLKLPKLYYINLKHRVDRKNHIIKELEKINYPKSQIHRIEAIKHEDGATGCGFSHIKALEMAYKTHNNENDYVIILEDDFTWIQKPNLTLKILQDVLNKKELNVILLAGRGSWENDPKYKYLSKVYHSQTSSGYIIRIGYIPKLLNLWRKDMSERNTTKKYIHDTCIDQSWKQLQHEDWYITDPKLGYQWSTYSDIEKYHVNYGV